MLIILENQDTGVVKAQSNGFLQVSAGKRKKKGLQIEGLIYPNTDIIPSCGHF